MFELYFQSLHDGLSIRLVGKLNVVPFELFDGVPRHPAVLWTFHGRCDGREVGFPRKIAGFGRSVGRAVIRQPLCIARRRFSWSGPIFNRLQQKVSHDIGGDFESVRAPELASLFGCHNSVMVPRIDRPVGPVLVKRQIFMSDAIKSFVSGFSAPSINALVAQYAPGSAIAGGCKVFIHPPAVIKQVGVIGFRECLSLIHI